MILFYFIFYTATEDDNLKKKKKNWRTGNNYVSLCNDQYR